MTPQADGPESLVVPADRSSFWELLAIPVQRYRFVLFCMVALCGLQLGRVYLPSPTYTSGFDFRLIQSSLESENLQRLAVLAGFSARAGRQSQYNWYFFVYLMRSREVLNEIMSKTYELPDGRKVSLSDVIEVDSEDGEAETMRASRRWIREVIGIERLRDAGVTQVRVTTRWPEASYAVAQGLVEAMESYNSTVTRGEARREKAFVAEQLERTRTEVDAWEDSLQAFLAANRGFSEHSEMTFMQRRIEAELQERRVVHTELQRAYLQAQINEVREHPALFVTAYPRLPNLSTRQDFDVRMLLLPLLTGMFAGAVATVGAEWLRRGWDYNNPLVATARGRWPRLTALPLFRIWFWPEGSRT